MEESFSDERIERRIITYQQDDLMLPEMSDWTRKYVIGEAPEEPTQLEIISEVVFIDPNSIRHPVIWIKIPEIPGLETDNSHSYFRISNNHNLIFRGINSWEGKNCFSLRDEKMDYSIKKGMISESFPRVKDLSLSELADLEKQQQLENFRELLKKDAGFRKEVEADLGINQEFFARTTGINPVQNTEKTDLITRKLDKIIAMLGQKNEAIPANVCWESDSEDRKISRKRIYIRIDNTDSMTLEQAANQLKIHRTWLSRRLKKENPTVINGHRVLKYDPDSPDPIC